VSQDVGSVLQTYDTVSGRFEKFESDDNVGNNSRGNYGERIGQ
jgi:hypothetical protein